MHRPSQACTHTRAARQACAHCEISRVETPRLTAGAGAWEQQVPLRLRVLAPPQGGADCGGGRPPPRPARPARFPSPHPHPPPHPPRVINLTVPPVTVPVAQFGHDGQDSSRPRGATGSNGRRRHRSAAAAGSHAPPPPPSPRPSEPEASPAPPGRMRSWRAHVRAAGAALQATPGTPAPAALLNCPRPHKRPVKQTRNLNHS